MLPKARASGEVTCTSMTPDSSPQPGPDRSEDPRAVQRLGGQRRADLDTYARSFGAFADAYDRGRPSYPPEAVAWMTGSDKIVLELGAGTGKLTRLLVDLGHGVYATDVDDDMLAVLRANLPDVPTAAAPAEEIPMPDHCVEVVVCAQAFHWFDFDKALAEISRVLVPGGTLALVWNERDERIPWVRRLGELIGSGEQLRDPSDLLTESELFTDLETAEFKYWQQLDGDGLIDLVTSRSAYATADEATRSEKLARVRAFYDEFNRGVDGLLLPYVTRCFKVTAVDTSVTEEPESDPEDPGDDGVRLIELD